MLLPVGGRKQPSRRNTYSPPCLAVQLHRKRRHRRPGFFLNAFANDAYLEGLIRCKEQGLADAVGVSNFTAQRLRGAVKTLGARGVPLASNQARIRMPCTAPGQCTLGALACCAGEERRWQTCACCACTCACVRRCSTACCTGRPSAMACSRRAARTA